MSNNQKSDSPLDVGNGTSVNNENAIDDADELVLEYGRIDFNEIDEEKFRLNYRLTQIEPEPAPIRTSESEEDEEFRINFQSISFSDVNRGLSPSWLSPSPSPTPNLYPSASEIEELVHGQLLLTPKNGKEESRKDAENEEPMDENVVIHKPIANSSPKKGTDESTLYDFEDELETEKSPRQLSDTSNTSAAQGQKRVRALSPGSNEDGEGRTGAKKRRGFVLV